MRKILQTLLAVSCFAGLTNLRAQTVGDAVARIHRERIQASYLIALGRLATEDEVKYWIGQNPKSVSDLVTRHRDYLTRDNGTHQDVIRRSYLAALGKPPSGSEMQHWMAGSDTYTNLVTNHTNWLRSNPAQYVEVIKRSYQNVLGRPAKDAEVNHWKNQGVFAYCILAACHEDWKKRGGEATATATKAVPTSSSFLNTVSVSPNILSESKLAVSSLIGNDGASMVAAGGGNMVAAGGGNMVAAGGGNMVAAGGGN
jgi:hypothetical protein